MACINVILILISVIIKTLHTNTEANALECTSRLYQCRMHTHSHTHTNTHTFHHMLYPLNRQFSSKKWPPQTHGEMALIKICQQKLQKMAGRGSFISVQTAYLPNPHRGLPLHCAQGSALCHLILFKKILKETKAHRAVNSQTAWCV